MDRSTKTALALGTAGIFMAVGLQVSDFHSNVVALIAGGAALAAYGYAGWHALFGEADKDGSEDLRDNVPRRRETLIVAGPENASPDWPLRNLFFRLNPRLSSTRSKTDFDTVADDILDKLATGRLLAWGRAIDGSRTLPLYPIPEDYWLHASLNIWLLDNEPGGGNILQASPVEQSAPNKTQYKEILINRAQAIAEWPDLVLRQDPVPEFIPLPEAARRVLEGNLNNLIGEAAMREHTAERRLDWYANWIVRSKKVPIYGMRPPSHILELIDLGLMPRFAFQGGAAELWEHYANFPTYTSLAIKSVDIDNNWAALTTP